MWSTTLQGHRRPQAALRLHLRRRRARRRLPRRHPRARRHRSAAASTRCSRRRTTAPTRGRAQRHQHRQRRHGQRGVVDPSVRRHRPGRARRGCGRGRRHRPGPDRRRRRHAPSAARAHRRSGRAGSTIPPSSPTGSPRAGPRQATPGGPVEIVIDRDAADDREARAWATPPPCSCPTRCPSWSSASSPSVTTTAWPAPPTPASPPPTPPGCSAAGAPASTRSGWPPEPGIGEDELAARSVGAALPSGHRGDHRRRAQRRAAEGSIEDEFLDGDAHDAAGLRRRRPAGRHLQHPQHLLDRRRPAQPRVRPAAGDRRHPRPGPGLGRARGARRRGAGHRGRHRRRGRRWRSACWRRSTPPVPGSRRRPS